MTRRSANGLLHVLGAEVGIPQLHLDKEGCCSVAFDDIVVNFEVDEASHRLFLYASLGPLPATGEAALYADLLEANLAWRGTDGATLSLDRQEGRVVLMRSVHVGHISDADFKAAVEAFVASAEAWTRRIADVPAEPAAEPPFVVHPGMFA